MSKHAAQTVVNIHRGGWGSTHPRPARGVVRQAPTRARNLAPKTVEIYTGAAAAFGRWLVTEGIAEWSAVRRADLESYVGDLARNRSAGYASNQYRALQQFFKWLFAEEEISRNPMVGMSPPDGA